MKKTLLIVLALLLISCSLFAPPAPTAAPTSPAAKTEVPAAAATVAATAAEAPTATAAAATAAPLPTRTPEPTQAPSATPFTEPVIAARFPMHTPDALGFGSNLLALPGGQVWETTTGGGVRVYNSADMTVLKSLNLKGKGNAFTRLVGDEQYVWALFYTPAGGPDAANLFRISRADYGVTQVDLPGTCTYEDCLWSYLLVDGDVLWVGGYDELRGFNRDSLEQVAEFLYSEQAHTFYPAQVADLDVTADGQLWALFCSDVCYIVILDKQKLLDGMEQEPEMITFANSSVAFVTRLGEAMWAGESSSGNVDVQPAVLYRLDETGAELSPQDGIELPGGLDFTAINGSIYASDGKCLWVLNNGGRKLFWFDPAAGEVAGVLQIYPGDEPTAKDPKMLMSISFDGQNLWGGGVEILRIAVPWVK